MQADTIILVAKKYHSKMKESKVLCGLALGNPSFVVPAHYKFQPLLLTHGAEQQ